VTGTLAAVGPTIPAPHIEYSQLSPMLVVFGAAVAAILVEAFTPRPLRRTVQLVITLGSILAAFKQMTASYQARYDNAVLIMTAGVDNAPGDITPAQLISQLRTMYDPKRKIEIDPFEVVLARAPNLYATAFSRRGQAFFLNNFRTHWRQFQKAIRFAN